MGSIESTFSGSVHICEIIFDISLKEAFFNRKTCKIRQKMPNLCFEEKILFPTF